MLPAVTVAQLGGCWFVCAINQDKTCHFIGMAHKEIKPAQKAAKLIAQQRQVFLQDKPHILEKPIVTIWKTGDDFWVTKLFRERADMLESFDTLTNANQMAVRLSIKESLVFLPFIASTF